MQIFKMIKLQAREDLEYHQAHVPILQQYTGSHLSRFKDVH
jgi:hypothetical protein